MNETTFSTALFGPLCRDLYRDSNNFTRRPISAGEQRTRGNLAALYRILDLYGMSDLANQEVSARIADEPNRYLVHPYGYFYDEITASCLIRIDEHGLPVDDAPWLNDGGQNLAKWIYNQREDIHYFIHGHCENVMAESCLPEGLLPLSQPAVYLSNLVGYIDYEFVEDETFGQKFMQHVAHHDILISRNHGYYWLGRTAEEAFFRAYYLRQACEV